MCGSSLTDMINRDYWVHAKYEAGARKLAVNNHQRKPLLTRAYNLVQTMREYDRALLN